MLKQFLIFIIFTCVFVSGFANNKAKSVVDADEVFYDKNTKEVIASGHVEIYRDGLLINSDKLTYNQINNTIIASGKVRIVEAEGQEFFGSEIELLRSLKKLVIYDLVSKIENKMTFGASKSSYEIDSKIIKMHKASVTTCEVCKGKRPQWVFNSNSVKHDYNGDRVHHFNSFVKFYGLPVFYLPYFSHLTPNAKPRSGFLFPSYKYKTFYGNGAELKYYHRFSDHADLLYSPMITEKQGILHQLTAESMFVHSRLKFKGSYNKSKKDDLVNSSGGAKRVKHRYHLDASYDHNFNKNYFLEMQLNKVSDKAYLDQFYTKNKNYLTSYVNLNFYDSLTYGSIKNLYFQGLRNQDDPKMTPYALPLIDFHKEAFYKNNNYIMEFNSLNLKRETGSEVYRSVLSGQVERQFFLKNGLNFSNSLLLRGDAYSYKNLSYEQKHSGSKNKVFRAIPTYEANIRLPLISRKYDYVSLLQPLIQVVTAPNLSKNKNVINEDSLNVEISDANLFSNNRYSGYDKYEDGSRINYGLMGTIAHSKAQERYYHYMVGQSYRLRKNNSFGPNSGMQNKSSDIVGNFGVSPFNKLDILYRYRFDQGAKTLRRSEANIRYTYSDFSLGYKFVKYNYKYYVNDDQVNKSMGLNPQYKLNEFWNISGEVTRNSTKKRSFFVTTGIKFIYNGQCSLFGLSILKNHTNNQMSNNKKSTSFTVDFIPKGI